MLIQSCAMHNVEAHKLLHDWDIFLCICDGRKHFSNSSRETFKFAFNDSVSSINDAHFGATVITRSDGSEFASPRTSEANATFAFCFSIEFIMHGMSVAYLKAVYSDRLWSNMQIDHRTMLQTFMKIDFWSSQRICWSCCRIVFCFHLMLIQMLARSQNISKAQSTIWIRHSKLSQTTKDRLTIKMFSTAPQVYHSPLKLFWKAIWPKRSLLATKGKSFHRTATHYDLLMMETKRISK